MAEAKVAINKHATITINLSEDELRLLKAINQNPYWNLTDPEMEPKEIKELRKLLFDTATEALK